MKVTALPFVRSPLSARPACAFPAARRLGRLACLLGLLCSAGLAHAQPARPAAGAAAQPAAEMRSVTGVVFAQSTAAEPRILQVGAKLFVGDTVGTNKGAFALLVFGDGSRVALRPESAMVIRGFNYKPDDPANDQMSVQLLKGWLRNVSGQISKRGNSAAFDMKVGDSTIGIRGTDFAVRLCDEACATAPPEDTEGVLPQSGRLGQVLAADRPLARLRADGTVEQIQAGAVLRLGDVIGSAEVDALVSFDDGTRLVLAPGTVVALRAEEDARGRRALRLDLMQGTVRAATPVRPGARLYGLLVAAGQLLGVRQNSAVDVSCEVPAAEGDLACPAASVTLRQGQTEVLSGTGLRSLRPGAPERLREEEPADAQPEPAAPPRSLGPPPDAAPVLALEWDTWTMGEGLTRPVRLAALGAFEGSGAMAWWPLPALEEWHDDRMLAQAPGLPGTGAGGGGRTSGLPDPLDIAPDTARPRSVAMPALPGVYMAVYSGAIEVRNPAGLVVVPFGQAAFIPPVPTLPPQLLPAAPLFMERDRELERGRLYPGQCLR